MVHNTTRFSHRSWERFFILHAEKYQLCFFFSTQARGKSKICNVSVIIGWSFFLNNSKRKWSRKTSTLPRLYQRLSICQRYLRFPIYISRGIEKFKECKVISSWKNHRSVFLHTKSYVELTRRGWFERNGGIWYVMQFFL